MDNESFQKLLSQVSELTTSEIQNVLSELVFTCQEKAKADHGRTWKRTGARLTQAKQELYN
jgi:hypothetical protein